MGQRRREKKVSSSMSPLGDLAVPAGKTFGLAESSMLLLNIERKQVNRSPFFFSTIDKAELTSDCIRHKSMETSRSYRPADSAIRADANHAERLMARRVWSSRCWWVQTSCHTI